MARISEMVFSHLQLCRKTCFISLTIFVVLFFALFKTYNLPIMSKIFPSIIALRYEKNSLETEFRLKSDYDTNSTYGYTFNVSWNEILDDLNLLNVRTIDDYEVFQSNPVIGTAISSNHFEPYKELLQSIARVYNGTKLVYLYDLGMKPEERTFVLTQFGGIVKEIRNFTFDRYPTYFKHLRGFRWKPLVVAHLLKDFPSIWWMDASVRVVKPLDHFYTVYKNCTTTATCGRYPWTLISTTDHSIFSATDKRQFDYLPMSIELAKNVTMWAATCQLIFGTKHVRENALRYWVLCALEQQCMDPPGSKVICSFSGDRFRTFAHCNRQDQSAISIILGRLNNFTIDRFCRHGENVIHIIKESFVV